MPDNVEQTNSAEESANMQPSQYGYAGKPPLIPREEWEPIWPGSKLDWSSPHVPIQLYVELPFWLMMPEGTFDVKYDATTVKIAVIHGCEEIQQTTTHSKNRSSTVFIARPNERIPEYVQRLIDQSRSGCSVRIHRTTLILETVALESALKLRTGTQVQRAHSIAYLSAMAVGHLPLVNTLVTAYRRAANDPFVQEVSEATVPIWFVRRNDCFLRVSVYPYADLEYRADWPRKQGTQEPADLATADEVVEFLCLKETPGETILHDAWSYFYAGRFSDSIRGLVSALEVLLEAKYTEALRAQGNNDEMVEAALRATATKFTTRFNNYLHLTKRTVPGPLLSWAPYITGVRLREELNQTRELRHKIVHEGHRMSPYAHGAMLRAAETMTWLFDWLEDDERSSRNRFKLYQLKSFLKGRVQFGTEYLADGVKVMERKAGPPTEDHVELMADDQQWGKHTRALYGAKKDFVLFAKMSLACVLADSSDIMRVMGRNSISLTDSEILKPLPGVKSERFRTAIDGLAATIFLIELDGELTIPDLSGVMVRLLQLRVEAGNQRVHGVCIVNHQQHIPPASRESYRNLPEDLRALLASCDLSLAYASDLARYIRCARDYGWTLTPIREAMKASGFMSCQPPNSTYAGVVLKVFPNLGVLGMNLDAKPALAKGDRILVMSASRYEAMDVGSIEVNKKAVDSVSKGQAGVKVAGDVKQIPEGAFVFRVSPPPPPFTAESSADGTVASANVPV